MKLGLSFISTAKNNKRQNRPYFNDLRMRNVDFQNFHLGVDLPIGVQELATYNCYTLVWVWKLGGFRIGDFSMRNEHVGLTHKASELHSFELSPWWEQFGFWQEVVVGAIRRGVVKKKLYSTIQLLFSVLPQKFNFLTQTFASYLYVLHHIFYLLYSVFLVTLVSTNNHFFFFCHSKLQKLACW